MKQIIRLTESDIKRIVKLVINEAIANQENEQMLIDLFNYLSKKPTDDIYDGGTHINTSYKAYNYFIPKEIVHNVWAIHYTNAEGLEDIQQNGFNIGVSNYDELAYSSNYHSTKRNSGWNFALPIDNKYLGEDLGYGDCAFLIKTDGVRAYHKGDHDDEIIFKECMVKQKIPFVYDEDYDCWFLLNYKHSQQNNNLPKDAYYNNDLKKVVFDNVQSLIKFAISIYSV